MRRRVWALAAGLFVTGTAAAYVPQQPPAATTAAAATKGKQDFDRRLRELDARERALDTELEEIGPKLDVAHRRMVARGRAYYRMVRAGLLPVGGGFDGLVDHATAVERLRAALGRDIDLQRKLELRKSTIQAELRKLRTERAPLMIQREAVQRASSAMQQADERRDAFLRAFGGSEPLPHLAVYGASGPLQGQSQVAFSKMRGRLSFPLTGRSEVLTQHEPSKGPSGVTLIASRDTAVRAVFPGRVVFVGKTQRGGTVVLDHGDSYFTVYGGLHHTEVKVGEVLLERGRMGWILRYGNDKPTLYFEVRRSKKLLDAARWLGV